MAGSVACAVLGSRSRADEAAPQLPEARWPGFPWQGPATVREFVGACHGDVDSVRRLLGAHPALANAAVDWGFGDWETALGAAAHTGRKAIADLLFAHGARPDIFAVAMLGMTDALRALIAAQPGIEATRGPHGITLLAHAEAGKSQETIEFLRTLPGATGPSRRALSGEDAKAFFGEYRDEGGTIVTVEQTRFGMACKAAGSSARLLLSVGENQFHPAGAPNVRVTFTLADQRATRVEFVEDAWFLGASRVP